MGVSIKSSSSIFSFDAGYSSFFRLRLNICRAFDTELATLYERLALPSEELYRKINDCLNDSRFKEEDNDILDFLFASDSDDIAISHKTCKKIYDLIKDIDFGNQTIRYAAHAHNDYEEFKQFLLDCYSHRAKMRWC